MQGIILSKDRAAQCNLLLDSIEANLDWFDNLCVVYKSSNSDFQDGYERVIRLHNDVSFYNETSYREDILRLLDESYGYTVFFTDDDIVFQNRLSDKADVLDLFEFQQNIGCFSLRLGLNTTVQDQYNCLNTIPPKEILGYEEFILWDWTSVPNYMNFGYPCSVDGHIFRTGQLKELLLKCNFTNPNQQEIAMNNLRNCIPNVMASFRHSCLVNTPINRVQETCANRNGEKFGIKPEDINKRFMDGNFFDLTKIDFSNIVGCHQELELIWNT